ADKRENDAMFAVLTEAVQNRENWVLLCLEGLRGIEKTEVQRALLAYRKHLLFYDYHPEDKLIRRSLRELQEKERLPDGYDREIAEAAEQWSALGWIHNDERFAVLLDRLKSMKLPPSRLMLFLRKLTDEWNELYSSILPSGLVLPEGFYSWHEANEWFRQIRKTISRTLGAPHYSQEVQDAVMRAVQLIQEQLSGQLYAADIAKRVNMSRSYFSQCFRDIIGKTFNEYVRQARVDKAKEYLVHTNMPILWVAEKTGYLDGKYFSTVFREQTGELPSAFRKTHRKE
ncbi:helix-turn-helix transcriptional regulator, partial [Paenibacillus sepulcri]|nr:helix-turn-helix transcriptional regulator [Paenibacillus sepulcri]